VSRWGGLLFVLAASICPLRNASAQDLAQKPWYIEASAGALWRTDRSYSTTFFNSLGTTGPGTNTETFYPGPVINLGFGYYLPFGFRAEMEAGYARYTASSISPVSTNGAFPELNGSRLNVTSGAARDQYTGSLNVFYDFPDFGSMAPYVGLGTGAEYINSAVGYFSGPGVPVFTQLAGHTTDILLLAEMGVALKVDADWSIVPSYRFQSALPTSGPVSSGTVLNAHIFKIGIRYSPASLVLGPVPVDKDK
jgi:opacity protein-like surface antigen